MIKVTLSWSLFQAKELPITYADSRGNYYLYSTSETSEYSCVIPKSSRDALEFEEGFKDSATSLF